MKKTIKTLMIGTSLSNQGGISSVIKLYQDAGLMENIQYLASSKDTGSIAKVLMFAGFLLQLMFALLGNRQLRIAHMHVSQRGSFVRKSLALMICKLFGKKVIWHMHGSEFTLFYQSASPLYQRMIIQILDTVDCLIALSESRKAELLEIAPDARVTVVYNPCQLQQPMDRDVDQTVHFLFMGRFGHRKGVYDIIKAVSLLGDRPVKVLLHGDGEVQKVKDMVHQAGLTGKIEVNGWISGADKHSTFLKSHVLLLPSYNEGLPMAILEAMSYSMPVISTPVGGIAEAVVDGFNGYLVQPGDDETLAERMKSFIDSPGLISQMGRQGYDLAGKTFELSLIIEQMNHIYNEMGTEQSPRKGYQDAATVH